MRLLFLCIFVKNMDEILAKMMKMGDFSKTS